jgi:hypothetical protein
MVPEGERTRPEFSVSDKDDKNAVINLVPVPLAKAIDEALFTTGELFHKDERVLWKELRSREQTPTPMDNRLRLKFWVEYDRCLATGSRQMIMANVVGGICSRELFYYHYLKYPHKVAWLVCPPTDYMTKASEALEFGLEQMRDILDMPHATAGKLDAKLAEIKLKIIALLDARVRGAVVQKTLNVNASVGDVKRVAEANSVEELEKQLKELRRRDQLSKNIPTPGQVEVLDPE